MQELNMPEFDHQVKKRDDKLWIFDILRKKHIFLTPEEWVRQNLIHYLINYLGYPKSLIKVETGLKYDRRQKRSDVLVYDREGQVFLLVECKAMHIKIGQDTLEQVSVYNHVLKAQHIMITNGHHYLVYATNHEAKQYELIPNIPVFPGV
ncbi:type I restriction enzyme HsdR N-terminal domain-containing protein [Microscilla marina]|uniref:Type I restriction enzyme r protein n terminus (Hsdr_n) n=1 Tax=Microscilla marina ATCC 23134 TaxID=313606 RepID=A1ZYN1_MICM2|nr:type I restriction enzyme HsdR N-terminal domain-containing protein [Microscilla marina]EAY24534.1 type I restriction enzyme r protein n terminus (hsdr_n) [Microscilla marina ATCC 23134]